MPTPAQLAKSGTEHGHQTALFAWAAMACRFGFEAANDDKSYTVAGHAERTYGVTSNVPELKWFHAIPNGGTRGDDAKSRAIRGGQLKAEGVRQGVPDTFLPVPRNGWHGLYIEMKRPGKIKDTSKEQDEFGEYAKSVGFGWIVCDDWRKAADVLISYLTYRSD